MGKSRIRPSLRLFMVWVAAVTVLAACGGESDVAVSSSASSDVTVASELGESVTSLGTVGTVATQRPTTAVPTTEAVTTTVAPTTAPTTTEPTTTTEAEPVIANDAEAGLRFDVGHISSFEQIQGVTIMQFDRYQAYSAELALISGLDHQSEYIIGAITDWPFLNENPKLRSYPVAPSAQVVITSEEWLAGQDEFCGGDGSQLGVPVTFVPTVIETGLSGVVTSLTFDELGWVTMIRFMLSC